MRVLIGTTQVPFVHGGAEIHAGNLLRELRSAGHEAELVSIPFKHDPPERILENMLACRLLDVSAFNGQPIDRFIGLKFPAYLLAHPRKVMWVLHQYRPAYDLWDTPYGDLLHAPNGVQIRQHITLADNKALGECEAVFANSGNVAARLKQFNQFEAAPLYHPPNQAELFYHEAPEDYFFFPSRLTAIKRQELVIRALAETKSPAKVLFAGRADRGDYRDQLASLIQGLNVGHKAMLLGGISDEDMRRYYARSIGVLFTPVDEDYGYITLEAMLSHKAVITCSDSGGPLEFVRHGETGLVVDSTPTALAAAIDQLWGDRILAREMGGAGRAVYEGLDITWANVIQRLLA